MQAQNNTSILIVDDEDMVRGAIAEIFEMNDFEVFQARDGEEAMELLSKQKVESIITDVRMPRMDGVGLIQSIHENLDYDPVILCFSGYSDLDLADSYRKGVSAYFNKPLSMDALVELFFVNSEGVIER